MSNTVPTARALAMFQDVKAHLNITSDEDDALIAAKIEAAEIWVSRWLATPLRDMEEVPADLKQAVMMLVGHWFENREASLIGIDAREVPFGVLAIIDAHREWAF